jgi:hypothetical protein
VLVEVDEGHAGLDDGVVELVVDFEDLVHAVQVERDRAVDARGRAAVAEILARENVQSGILYVLAMRRTCWSWSVVCGLGTLAFCRWGGRKEGRRLDCRAGHLTLGVVGLIDVLRVDAVG